MAVVGRSAGARLPEWIRCATTHRESLEFQATILHSFSHYFAKSRGRRQPTQAISKACSKVHRRCLQNSPWKYGSWISSATYGTLTAGRMVSLSNDVATAYDPTRSNAFSLIGHSGP